MKPNTLRITWHISAWVRRERGLHGQTTHSTGPTKDQRLWTSKYTTLVGSCLLARFITCPPTFGHQTPTCCDCLLSYLPGTPTTPPNNKYNTQHGPPNENTNKTTRAKLHLAYRWYRFCLQWGDINFIGLGFSVLRDSHQCLVLKFMISWRPKSDFILGQFCQTRARRSSSICRSSERWWRSSTILITYRSSMDTRSEVISLSKWRRQQLMWVKL